ncbi:MAG: glutamine--fructose-6-phosphate aminotransferase [isomerizing] [Planctomycetota bacterium]|nr:MAG: glutamine--fructose-6-phosphate aminotransferase [isomerizing] [Planctomycetota bacterium]
MCGIMGVTGVQGASRLLLEGLKTLEYRGYDSAGVAVQESDELFVMRRSGKLANLESALAEREAFGVTGLGHTRWATHGPPVERNAHPLVDGAERVAVVHNGIVENHESLRNELLVAGVEFRSDTDTEIIAHLVARELTGGADLAGAVRATAKRLEGAFALGVLSADHPDTLVALRCQSPLVLGIGEGASYLASDIPALLAHTRRMIPMDDGDVAVLTPQGITITDLDGNAVERAERRIDWDPVTVQKGGYRHFMLKEIDEQPAAVSATMVSRLDDATGSIHMDALDEIGPRLAEVSRLTFIACGTSWHAGLAGKFYIENLVGMPVDVDYASEFRYRSMRPDAQHLIVPITQSGETLDTLSALRDAKANGAPIISVVNVPESSATRESDATILTLAGPEIGVASTKAFTTQLVALYMLALDIAVRRGKMSHDEAAARIVPLRRLRYAMEGALRGAEKVAEVAHKYHNARDFLFLGRGVNYPVALEGALKLKEISYIHAEGYPAGEMKHGPIALIDEHMPVVVIATPGKVYEKVLSNIQEVKSRDGKVIAVCAEGDERVAALADEVLEVPEVDEDLSPLVNVVPLQLLAYHVAERRGCDIDQPRNLAKSVTVE